MTSATSKINKLFKLRSVRRKAAEQRAAAAAGASMTADQLRETRRGEFESTVDNADSTRKRRLQAIFAAAESHGVHQAVAVAAYERTQDEINKARHAWRDARDEAVAARERAVMAQRELARAMQVEEKVRLLARNLLQRENEEAARQE